MIWMTMREGRESPWRAGRLWGAFAGGGAAQFPDRGAARGRIPQGRGFFDDRLDTLWPAPHRSGPRKKRRVTTASRTRV